MQSAHPYLVGRKERGEEDAVTVEVAADTSASAPSVRTEWHTHTLCKGVCVNFSSLVPAKRQGVCVSAVFHFKAARERGCRLCRSWLGSV